MKRVALVALLAVFATGVAKSQDFDKGDLVFGATIGLMDNLRSANYKTTIPPISLTGEGCVTNPLFKNGRGTIGVGGYLGFAGSKWEGAGTKINTTNILIGARGALHYQFVNRLDTYAGVMLGYNIASNKVTGTGIGASASGFGYSLFLGARYYLSDNFALMAELGYGVASVNLGVAYRF